MPGRRAVPVRLRPGSSAPHPSPSVTWTARWPQPEGESTKSVPRGTRSSLGGGQPCGRFQMTLAHLGQNKYTLSGALSGGRQERRPTVRASPSFHLGRSDRTPHIEAAWSRLPSAIRSQPPGSQVPEESRGADAAARRPCRGFPGPGRVQTSIEAGADHCPSPHGTCGVPKGSQGQEAALIPGRGSGRRPPPHGRRKRMPLSGSPSVTHHKQ
jgi:hypothetical protein